MLLKFQPTNSDAVFKEEEISKTKEELLTEVYDLREKLGEKEKELQNFIHKELQLKKYLDELEYHQTLGNKKVDEFSSLYSKLKESEQKLKELNSSKDKFFSIIAHDLRSPFTSLLGFSEYLAKHSNECTQQEVEEYSIQMYKSAKNIFDLLENLLQWSRLQAGKLDFIKTEVNLGDISKRIFELFKDIANSKSIVIKNKLDISIVFKNDVNILETIFRNLVSNAIKFTNPGGEIILTSAIYKDQIEFSVKDNGVGMSIEEVDKLFRVDIQHTTKGTNKEKGTGLGLILCKEFVEKCGGNIQVSSILGKGSEFKFTLPLN